MASTLCPNTVGTADSPATVDVVRVCVDAAKAEVEYFKDDQEIDGVNMCIQRHGCGGCGHYKVEVPDRVGRGWEHRKQGSRQRAHEFGQGSWRIWQKAAEVAREQALSLTSFPSVGRADTASRNAPKMAPSTTNIPIADAPAYFVESA